MGDSVALELEFDGEVSKVHGSGALVGTERAKVAELDEDYESPVPAAQGIMVQLNARRWEWLALRSEFERWEAL
jgi:hypothetical protein